MERIKEAQEVCQWWTSILLCSGSYSLTTECIISIQCLCHKLNVIGITVHFEEFISRLRTILKFDEAFTNIFN
jgi:hypothetical protein